MKRLLIALLVLFTLPALAQQTQYIPRLKTDSLTAKTANNVYYAKQYATAGSGTQADPWTGWSAAIASGHRVVFSNGYYGVAANTAISLPSDVDLDGDGSAYIIPTGNDAGNTGLFTIDASAANVSNVSIRNLIFDGNSKTKTWFIRVIQGASTNAVKLRIERNTLQNIPKVAIVIGQANDLWIANNKFYNIGFATTGANSGGGVFVGAATGSSRGVHIIDNTFDTVGGAGSTSTSNNSTFISVINGVSDVQITGNTLRNGLQTSAVPTYGISVTTDTSKNITIADNTITDIAGPAINVTSSATTVEKNVVVKNNTINGWSQHTLAYPYNNQPAIFVATLKHAIVAGNTILNGGQNGNGAIEVNSVTDGVVSNNVVSGGRALNLGDYNNTGLDGIYVSGYGVSVTGNSVFNATRICYTGGNGAGINWVGNTARDCGDYSFRVAPDTSLVNCDVKDNTFTNPTVVPQYGLSLATAQCKNFIIKNNTIAGYSAAPFFFNASATYMLSGNEVTAVAGTSGGYKSGDLVATQYVTGGLGTAASPWTGWEGVVQTATATGGGTSAAYPHARVYFPAGVYCTSTSGVFSDITIGISSVRGLVVTGDGMENTVFTPCSTPGAEFWWFDNYTGAVHENSWQFLTFRDVQFRGMAADYSTYSTPAAISDNSKGFRIHSTGQEQNYVFERVRISGFHTGFDFEGTNTASEMRFFDSKITHIKSAFYVLANAQSMNHEFYGTDLESLWGSAFTWSGGANKGGAIKVFGGSWMIYGDGSAGTQWIVNMTSGGPANVSHPIVFTGTRFEFKVANSDSAVGLFYCPDNTYTAHVTFRDCTFQTDINANLQLVSIGTLNTVLFDRCTWNNNNQATNWYAFNFNGSTSDGGRITISNSYLPFTLSGRVTRTSAYGTFTGINNTGAGTDTVGACASFHSFWHAHAGGAGTLYWSLNNATANNATETNVDDYLSPAYPLYARGLSCVTATAPGAGTSVAYTLRAAGADSSPALACTISNTATSCTDTTNSTPIAASSKLDVKAVTTGAASASAEVICSLCFGP